MRAYFRNERKLFQDLIALRVTEPAKSIHEQFGFACGLSAVPAMAIAHRHDDVEVLVTEGGGAVLEHGGRRLQLADATCAVFWAGVPHRLTDTDIAVQVRWLTVPLLDVLGWSVPGNLAGELLQGMVRTFPASGLLTSQMAVWAADIGTNRTLTDAARHESRALLLRVSTVAAAAPADRSLAPSPAPGPGRHAAAIAAYISTHFHEPIRLADIAAAVHLHPSRATALFRQHTGVSIGQYLAQTRVAEAQRLLIATDGTTTDIAARAGFGSTSSFYATFRAHCGLAPDAYRRETRGARA